MQALNDKIREGQNRLAQEKAAAVAERFNRRLDEIGVELDKVIEKHQLLRKIRDINKEVFDESPHVFEERLERLRKRKNCAEESYEIVCKKITKLSSVGFTTFSLLAMSVIGWAGVITLGLVLFRFVSSKPPDCRRRIIFHLS